MRFPYKIRPRILITVTTVVSLLMLLSAYLELQQSKEEVFRLLSEQAVTLSETIISGSKNALESSSELEDMIVQRLLNNARLIKSLDSLNVLTRETIIKIGTENNLYRINIFDKKGDRVLTNRVVDADDHIHGEENVNRYEEVEAILTDKANEIIIGLKRATHVEEQRFAVAVARSGNRGAIVVNMHADDFLEFRRRIGIGKIIRDIGDNSGIEYVALQDSIGIMAANSKVKELSSFSDDSFLRNPENSDSIFTRLTMFEGREVYEVVSGLRFEDVFIGVFRIGISLDEVRSVEARMIRRLIVLSIILTTIGIILLSILITNQNLKSLSREFGNYKSFTNSFLQNMKESVINISNEMEITLFNASAENLLMISGKEALGKKINEMDEKKFGFVKKILSEAESFKNFELRTDINSQEKYLSISVIPNYNLSKGLESHTLILNDITDSKIVEEQVKRNEKLIAMGELASGVAHEVRNPINSIGMIAQRLSREFEPKNDSNEYDSITNLLKEEVNRINRIITQFLRYAKPLDIRFTEIDFNKYMSDIYQLYHDQAKQRKISFVVDGTKELVVKIDPELFKQALLNIIQNAFDAVTNGGKVNVKYFIRNKFLEVDISDNGKGIDKKDINKIFDLYYTTRKEGTGLGLSISQKIIFQHDGLINFTTGTNGTTFKIKLPVR